MTLDQLRGLDQDGTAQDAWAAERASQPGWLDGPGADGAACDATIVPVVSGHVDPGVLDRLTAALLHGPPPGTGGPGAAGGVPGETRGPGAGGLPGPGGGAGMSPARRRRAERAARQIILRAAADLMSGPAGLVSRS